MDDLTIAYYRALERPFVKLARLRFLQPDGSTAFALDNNPLNKRSGAFLADGNLSVNLQNGARRSANVVLDNVDGQFDYNVNKIWFGQEIELEEGLILPGGVEYYRPQGRFLISDPGDRISHNERTVTYNLVDKWASLDGSLCGNLEGTYIVKAGTNIFEPIRGLLAMDRGNGVPVDNVTPIFTGYYNGKTQSLPDGSTALLTDAPYTLRVDGDNGTTGDVILGLAAMLNAWVGYDQTGALRLDPSQDDVSDASKPILWRFSMDKATLISLDYSYKSSKVYNDYIVIGEMLDGNAQPAGRAQNLDPASDTNINLIGRKTIRESKPGFVTDTICRDYAVWKLKRAAVIQKAVNVEASQIFHIEENSLIEIVRSDKPGAPLERHLVQGFSRPIAGNGPMRINAISVSDFPIATVTGWPE